MQTRTSKTHTRHSVCLARIFASHTNPLTRAGITRGDRAGECALVPSALQLGAKCINHQVRMVVRASLLQKSLDRWFVNTPPCAPISLLCVMWVSSLGCSAVRSRQRTHFEWCGEPSSELLPRDCSSMSGLMLRQATREQERSPPQAKNSGVVALCVGTRRSVHSVM